MSKYLRATGAYCCHLLVLNCLSAEVPDHHAAAEPAAKPEWLVEHTQPINWLTWGFDLRLRAEYGQNTLTLQRGLPESEVNNIRIRPRIWTLISPAEQVSLEMRFMSEPRYYFNPESLRGWQTEEGLFDKFNAQLTNLFNQPAGVTLGRQEFAFGNRWLIWDGTGNDGSRTEFFDAARLTYPATNIATTFDTIYLNLSAKSDAWLPVINDRDRPVNEQNEQAGILYLRNTSIPETKLDGYFIYRQEEKHLARGNSGHIWLVGARSETTFWKQWTLRLEGAPEWGDLNNQDLRSWGINSLLTYTIGGSWNHRLRVGYEHLTGDDPHTEVNEGWDPMWARRAQWSELMVLAYALENRGRAGDYKNLDRPSVGWTFKPAKIVEVSTDYMPLFANENPLAGEPAFSDNGKFRGNFLQSIARFTLNQYWGGHLWTEYFWPGDYYAPDHRDFAFFVRAELTFKF